MPMSTAALDVQVRRRGGPRLTRKELEGIVAELASIRAELGSVRMALRDGGRPATRSHGTVPKTLKDWLEHERNRLQAADNGPKRSPRAEAALNREKYKGLAAMYGKSYEEVRDAFAKIRAEKAPAQAQRG